MSLDKLLECYFAAFSLSCFHIVCVSALVSTYYSISLFYATVPRWQTPPKHARTEGNLGNLFIQQIELCNAWSKIWTHRTQFGFISLSIVFATVTTNVVVTTMGIHAWSNTLTLLMPGWQRVSVQTWQGLRHITWPQEAPETQLQEMGP